MQVSESQKAELEEQISQLSEMSGDSSQQVSYLNDQLREKDKQMEELQGQHSSLSNELERIKQETCLQAEKLVSFMWLLVHINCSILLCILV